MSMEMMAPIIKEPDAAVPSAEDIEASPRHMGDALHLVDEAVAILDKLLAEEETGGEPGNKQVSLEALVKIFREIDEPAMDELEQAVLESLVADLIEPPVTTVGAKLRSLDVIGHLLAELDGSGSNEYDFADAFMDDPDALWALQEMVPYNEEPPTDPQALKLQQAAQRCILLAGGDHDALEVVWSAEQRVPVGEGEMVIWQIIEDRELTVDFTVSFVPAPEPASIYEEKDEAAQSSQKKEEDRKPESVVETVRVASHLGMYSAFEDGELVLKFTNRFSWMRHKRVRTITFKQHEWDFDEDEDMAHAHAHGHPPPPQTQTLQVATGPLREAITQRNLAVCRQIIEKSEDPIKLVNLYWDPAKRFTLLHYAAAQNAVPFAELLLANGAKTDMQSVAPHGFTPLFLAASHGFLQVVKMLVEAKANFSIPAVRPPQKAGLPAHTLTPVMHALLRRHMSVVQYLELAGAVMPADFKSKVLAAQAAAPKKKSGKKKGKYAGAAGGAPNLPNLVEGAEESPHTEDEDEEPMEEQDADDLD